MINNLDSASEHFLAAIERQHMRLNNANQRVASGRRILVASDAPDEISPLLQLKTDLRHNAQIQSNLALANTHAIAADQALDSSIKLMDRARLLATQAGDPMIDDAGRASIAQEIQAIQEQMVAYSRTAVQGRYLFSADQDLEPAYEFDLSGTNGVTQLIDPSATARVEYPTGGSFASTKTAKEIFDNRNPDGTVSKGNVFAALNSLRVALLSGDKAGLETASMSLRSAADQLNSMQSFYGAVQNRIASAANFASKHDIELHSELSQKEDADVAAAALEVTSANTELQAAFQMRAQMPHRSLFDYLG